MQKLQQTFYFVKHLPGDKRLHYTVELLFSRIEFSSLNLMEIPRSNDKQNVLDKEMSFLF
jgi:hypothetical protein